MTDDQNIIQPESIYKNVFKNPVPKTIREFIAVSYSNLAMAHVALKDNSKKYKRLHYIIRRRLYNGLITGTMSMRSLYDDEVEKLKNPQNCTYCGSIDRLSVDHLIPRIKGGPDEAYNLVLACRSCNSSKGKRDLLEWSAIKGRFPSILLLRRYIKIISRYCEANGLLETPIESIHSVEMPFNISLLPIKYPPISEMCLCINQNDNDNLLF